MSDLELTNYDYDDLKSSLIKFLKTYNPLFGDFDFEGSNIDSLCALLTRDTHYVGYMASMVANESFIDTAQLYENVASHAQDLSHCPTSCTCAKLVADIEVTPSSTTGLAISIEMAIGSTFLSTSDNTSYSFVNKEIYLLTYNSVRGTYKASDVVLYQGNAITSKLLYSGSALVLRNKRIDTSTLTVKVAQTTASATNVTFTEANDLQDLSSTSNVYFLSYNTSGYYQITFGKDILGTEPATSSIVTVTYLVAEEEHGNGVSSLTAASTIDDYSNITVTVSTNAYGGAEKEDIETMRFLAPLTYEAQNRCVTPTDYEVKLKKAYSFIKYIKAWGGEDNDTPQYGTVMISVIGSERDFVSTYIKSEMVDYLTSYNVGAMTPTIIDPVLIGISTTVNFAYDKTVTSKTFAELSALVTTAVQAYSDSNLNNFSLYYNNSALVAKLMAITGITTVNIDKSIFTDVDLVSATTTKYEFTFENALVPGSITISGGVINSAATETIYDDALGNIYLKQVISNVTTTSKIGTVTYSTGYIQFTATFTNTADTFRINTDIVNDNLYMSKNKIAYIDSITTSQISL